MTAVTVTPSGLVGREVHTIEVTRRHGMAIFLGLLAVVMFVPFGIHVPSTEHATFIMTAPPAVHVPNITMSVRWVSIVLSIFCAALAVSIFSGSRTLKRAPSLTSCLR